MTKKSGDQLAEAALHAHQNGEHEKARLLYKQALEKETQHKCYILINLGFLELAIGDIDSALARSNQAINNGYRLVAAYELKASAELRLGRKERALHTWRQAIRDCKETSSDIEKAELQASISCMAAELKDFKAARIASELIDIKLLSPRGVKNAVWSALLLRDLDKASTLLGSPIVEKNLGQRNKAIASLSLQALMHPKASLEGLLSENELGIIKELARGGDTQLIQEVAESLLLFSRSDLVVQIWGLLEGIEKISLRWLGILADAYYSIGAVREALHFFEATCMHPEYEASNVTHQRYRFDQARCRLALGDITPKTWEMYDERIEVVFQEKYTLTAGRLYPQLNRWKPDQGYRHLLLTHEQGLGDQILFGSMIPAFRKTFPGLEISLEVHPKLEYWTKKRFGDLPVYKTGQSIDKDKATFDSVLFLGSIMQFIEPCLLEEHLDDLERQRASSRIQITPKKPRLGLYWRSSDSRLSDAKSIRLDELEPLKRIDAEWYCLQDSLMPEELDSVLNWPMKLPDFDLREDLSAVEDLIQSLDGVVSISTTIAHMTCEMMKPTWVLLSETEGKKLWCWGDQGESTRFYPSAVLVRGLAYKRVEAIAKTAELIKAHFEDNQVK